MRVMNPSTSGWIVVERRDFSDATNSVVCSTGFAASVTISTGIGGGAPPGGPPPGPACWPPLPPHATPSETSAISE